MSRIAPSLFIEDGLVAVNSDCGNPFEQNYQVVHLVPEFKSAIEPRHLLSPGCWCQPELTHEDPDDGSEIWMHNASH